MRVGIYREETHASRVIGFFGIN